MMYGDFVQLAIVAKALGVPTNGVPHAAILAEAGLETLRQRREWLSLKLLSRAARDAPTHRLGRQWLAQTQDGEPTRFFSGAQRLLIKHAHPAAVLPRAY